MRPGPSRRILGCLALSLLLHFGWLALSVTLQEGGSSRRMSLGSFRLAPRTAGQPSGAAAPQGVGGPLLPAQSQAAATEEPSSATPGAPGQAYLEAIRVRIREHLRYPLSLQRRGVQGTALIRIELSPEGACERVALAGSSGHAELDELALSATKAASGSGPLGPPPTGVGRTIQVPVEFVLAR